MTYAIYQIDETKWGTETTIFSTHDYKDQADDYFHKILKVASSLDNANETQPTMNFKNVWHLYVDGNIKRSFVKVRVTLNCDGKAEAEMRSNYTWVD
jgi:hypothetical protein